MHGVCRCYLGKMTGLSRAQVTRLIAVYLGGEEVKAKAYRPASVSAALYP